VKIRTIASSTFGSFLYNRVVLVICIPVVGFFLLGIAAVLQYKRMTTGGNLEQEQMEMLQTLGQDLSVLINLGSLLAVWAAADSVASEMKSGTILAVMARPLHRWQFLTGKYFAVLMLMSVYIASTLGTTDILMRMGGLPLHISWWIMLVYPLVRYAVWAAIAIFLVNFMNPTVVLGAVAALSTTIWFFTQEYALNNIPAWIVQPIHLALPLTTVILSEDRFFSMTEAALKRYAWVDHAATLAYGVDYALVFFLLAILVFQRRSLTGD
jgi:ABC-type transport system involved in multi-copper enzyme maturation permease subunit